jgi:glycosyltransferase involved in cell wall biosynthesis
MAESVVSKKTSQSVLSVIIPHLNQPDGLAACLDSLQAQTLERSHFEIIVVDNGSRSSPAEVISRYPGVRLLTEPKPGPGLARNSGVRATSRDVLCFIDADCRAHPDWLSVAFKTMGRAPEHTILGGDVRIWREPNEPLTTIAAYESVFAYMQQKYIEKHGFSGTGNLVVRRIDFERVGPFAGIDVAEDMDWGRRALAAGLTFRYVPDLIIYHPPRRSMRELFVKLDRHTQHYLNMARGKPGWQVRWLARACAMLVSPAISIFKIMTTNRIEGVSTRLKAALVLINVRTYRAWKMVSLMWSGGEVVWNQNVSLESDDL